jgi:pilus assembly protein CpaB
VGGDIREKDLRRRKEMKNQIALVVAVVLAILAVIAVRTHLESVKEESQEGSERMGVVAAKRDIEKDEPLTSDVIVRKEVSPEAFVGMDLITWNERHSYVNMFRLQHKIPKNKFVTKSMLLRTGPTSLAASLLPGERAITIPVDLVSGVSGYISPGDHVDIYATFTVPGSGTGGERRADVKTYMLMSNVKVIRTGVKSAPVKQRRFAAAKSTAYTTVTLRAREQAAHILAFAQGQGRLHLTLRPPGDKGQPSKVLMDMESLTKILGARPVSGRK